MPEYCFTSFTETSLPSYLNEAISVRQLSSSGNDIFIVSPDISPFIVSERKGLLSEASNLNSVIIFVKGSSGTKGSFSVFLQAANEQMTTAMKSNGFILLFRRFMVYWKLYQY